MLVLGASFSSFGCFVFEFWVLRFRSWVLRFRDLGASCFGVFECFVFETTTSNPLVPSPSPCPMSFALDLAVYYFRIKSLLE